MGTSINATFSIANSYVVYQRLNSNMVRAYIYTLYIISGIITKYRKYYFLIVLASYMLTVHGNIGSLPLEEDAEIFFAIYSARPSATASRPSPRRFSRGRSNSACTKTGVMQREVDMPLTKSKPLYWNSCVQRNLSATCSSTGPSSYRMQTFEVRSLCTSRPVWETSWRSTAMEIDNFEKGKSKVLFASNILTSLLRNQTWQRNLRTVISCYIHLSHWKHHGWLVNLLGLILPNFLGIKITLFMDEFPCVEWSPFAMFDS